jgi:hypothetical protein
MVEIMVIGNYVFPKTNSFKANCHIIYCLRYSFSKRGHEILIPIIIMLSSRRGRYLALLLIISTLSRCNKFMRRCLSSPLVVAFFHYPYCYLYHIVYAVYIYYFLSRPFENLISTKTTDARRALVFNIALRVMNR